MIDTKKCRPAGFSCNFYDKCISKLIDCEGQEKNYFTNYGLKYCNIFKRKLYMNTGVTDTTRLWIRCTMKCLQSSILKNYRETDYINSLMEETQQAKCSRYYKDAFDSHPDCYTNSGLCFLMPPTQQTRIALAVDTDDLFSEESKAQIKEVFANCANDLLDYADGEETLPPNILKVLDLQGHEAAYEYCELENLNSEEKDPCFKLRNKVTNYLDVCI
ncbi:MAG: hypothetical protein HOM21_11840 [Halobacteriovoraceae bacterium]|nr:hypothetical protein [Halobacteriovoraceae bacterium]